MHGDSNAGLLAPSSSSIALMNRGGNSNDSGEKPNFIALFDYEQVNYFIFKIKVGVKVSSFNLTLYFHIDSKFK